RNSISQIPAERQRLDAELERDRARLEQARRNVEKTVITAPFDLRVSSVDAEVGQYVGAGGVLMSGDSIAAAEVEAEIPISEFRAILDSRRRPKTLSGAPELDRMLDAMGLTARVSLRATGGTRAAATWQARVDRISSAIDPQTRTVGVVVAVDDPYANARPPEQPPLVKGMYVAVTLCAPARTAAVVVPRTAIHAGQVYIADDNDRLEIRPVETAYAHGGFAVIGAGLEAGERVVVSDPVPAIGGMKLSVSEDPAAADSLALEAQGNRICP
ncbi:MAG TPA: efflux RND transporter periplasmic adaptor subunit, partial [Arenicellales bacterium]|nr:efflux RND transporter periplasmic adaptor subunit [Arenicellales bacterium]